MNREKILNSLKSTMPPSRRPLSSVSLKAHLVATNLVIFSSPLLAEDSKSLFDGETLNGWHSRTNVWRVKDGAITAGSHTKKFPKNEWIATEKSYANFELTLKIKCSGDLATGQVNSGIQIRSAWLPNKTVAGYQIDCGKGWFGKIFDEHRRRLIYPNPLNGEKLADGIDTFGWNEFRILADGPRIQVWINDIKATDYTETNPLIPLEGIIAPQIHSGGHVMVQFKDVMIRELPPTQGSPTWKSLGGVQAALDKVTPKKQTRKKAANKNPDFGRQVSDAGIRHSFLIAGTPTVLVGEDGKVKWTVPGKARDGYVLENGNIILSIGNVAKEFTPDKKVVWSYKLAPENKELGTVVRLENGNTLIVERGTKPRLREITKDGKVAIEVPLLPETDNAHMQTRMARKLPSGNYLVPHLLAFKVKEYQPDGTVVKEIKTDLEELGGREGRNWPFTAIRLKTGNTLVNLTNGNKTVEFDTNGKVVWKVTNKDLDERFADPCGGQRLTNGNTIICCYGQKNPKKVKIFEVTPDKKVVWEFFHPKARPHGIHVVTTNGKRESALK